MSRRPTPPPACKSSPAAPVVTLASAALHNLERTLGRALSEPLARTGGGMGAIGAIGVGPGSLATSSFWRPSSSLPTTDLAARRQAFLSLLHEVIDLIEGDSNVEDEEEEEERVL